MKNQFNTLLAFALFFTATALAKSADDRRETTEPQDPATQMLLALSRQPRNHPRRADTPIVSGQQIRANARLGSLNAQIATELGRPSHTQTQNYLQAQLQASATDPNRYEAV